MKTVVTYNSKTGFTKRYAEWIAEELGCNAVRDKDISNITDYDLVIHGGWLMGGMINGLDKIRKLNPKKIVAFGVGFTKEEGYAEKVKEVNHVDDIPTFYFVGGMNPKKLNFFLKAIVRMATKKPLEADDCTSREATIPLVELVKNLQ